MDGPLITATQGAQLLGLMPGASKKNVYNFVSRVGPAGYPSALLTESSTGTLQHMILGGIEGGQIVADRVDREARLARLGAVGTATGTAIYAWALLANHAHLLGRSGRAGLPRLQCISVPIRAHRIAPAPESHEK